MGYFVKKDKHGNEGMVVPSGPTADRPVTPIEAAMRYNTDTESLEYFNGTVFVQVAKAGRANIQLSEFVGDGIQVLFTPMTVTAATEVRIVVFVNGVFQIPVTHYTVSGVDITFASPPPNGEAITIIHNLDSTGVNSSNVF